jgi:hypothetical protein
MQGAGEETSDVVRRVLDGSNGKVPLYHGTQQRIVRLHDHKAGEREQPIGIEVAPVMKRERHPCRPSVLPRPVPPFIVAALQPNIRRADALHHL